MNTIFKEIRPDFAIKANKLDEKPTKFIPFNRLDSYNIETIFDSSSNVQISYQVYTEINQLINIYDTHNVEYNGSYYRIEFDFVVDIKVPPTLPTPIIILFWGISIISLIAITLLIIIVIVNVLRLIRRAGIL